VHRAEAQRPARAVGKKLEAYVNNGHVEIDNNQMENAIRPSAVGKKNWLFVGAPDVGQKSEIIYTLITETCRRYGIEPYEYFRDVLERLPTTNWLRRKAGQAVEGCGIGRSRRLGLRNLRPDQNLPGKSTGRVGDAYTSRTRRSECCRRCGTRPRWDRVGPVESAANLLIVRWLKKPGRRSGDLHPG